MHFNKAVFLDRDSMGGDLDMSALDSLATHWDHYATTTPDETLNRVHNADLVISNKVVAAMQISLSRLHSARMARYTDRPRSFPGRTRTRGSRRHRS